MLSINRLLGAGLFGVAICAATTAQAGNQLFEASWTVKALGNERTGGTAESAIYSAFGIPQGILCNPDQPRCPFDSTPTNGAGEFHPLGGSRIYALYCAPWANWQGNGTTVRPAKGMTEFDTGMGGKRIPPLYRNPRLFTSGGEPDTGWCSGTSRSPTTAIWPAGAKGLAQAGQPIVGKWGAVTTGTPGIGGFTFAAAPPGAAGVRVTAQVGEFPVYYPYVYSYTYATLRNDAGIFGPGKGPGSFNLIYKNSRDTQTVARINVKQGAAKFGGTMKMLGALTTKSCYYRNGGCSLVELDWRYEAIGAPAYTSGGVITRGYLATYSGVIYNPGLHYPGSIIVSGFRFPWTTGTVTVTATLGGKWRWPHTTIHYAYGYDNRNTTTPSGKGTIQLVTPVLTRWTHTRGGPSLATAGIGILRIEFLPEPKAWMMLVAGSALLYVGARVRGR